MAIYKLVSDKLLKCLQDMVAAIKCSLGKPNGIATLDSTGNVPADQLANAGGGGGSGVTSFNTRTGAVIPASNDYTFSQIGTKPTTILGYGITDAATLTGTQTLSNKTITGYQPTVTLTTTGTTGASTFSGNTLNIPNYSAGSSGITSVTGTTNQITASTTSGATTLSLPSNVHIAGTMFVGGTSGLQFGDTGIGGAILGYIVPRSDGVWELGNSAANAITRLMFGPSLTTNPAIVTNGSGISIKSSDSSLFTAVTAGSFVKSGGTSSQFLLADGTNTTTVTGTGAVVLATSPTLVTPTIGVATATTVNKVTITAPTTSATLTLVTGSSLITAGAFATTLTSTATTNVTLPTSGTLYGTATGSITSAQLAGSLSDETGTGLAVFGTSPVITTPTITAPHFKTSVQTGTTLTLDNTASIWIFSGTTAATWTLPAITGNTDLFYSIKNRGTVTVTITRAGSDNLYTTASVTTLVVNPGEAYQLSNDGSFWNVL